LKPHHDELAMTRPALHATFARRRIEGPRTGPAGSSSSRPGRRRPRARLVAESLEVRALLSAGGPAAVWAASLPVDPATSVLLRFTPQATAARQRADLAAVGGRVVTAYPDGPSVVELPPWADTAAALKTLQASGDVVYAQPDATIHADASIIPNDPKYSQQWGLAMVDAPQAWTVSTGNSSTIVAVIDTGIDLRNTEFAGRLWVNKSASTPRNVVYGWNFVSNNGNTQDDNGHGTHVSGILGAKGNNNIGVAGIDWGTKIMPLKSLDAQGNGTTDEAVAAVYFAVNNGAKVINASWGGDVWTSALRDALTYANSKGVVFVTAAGNESSNNDVTTTYPASFRTPNELVVAAVDSTGNLASYSNYGATTVDLAAPGTSIISTVPGGYAYYTGTSMATPFVTGTVALLATKFPGMSASQLVGRVLATVKPMASLQGLTVTGGVVDPYNALVGQVTATSSPLSPGTSSFSTVESNVLTSDAYYASVGGTPDTYVEAIVPALVGRPADPATVAIYSGWLSGGMSRTALVQLLQGTPEAQRTRVIRWYNDDLGWALDINQAKSNPGVIFWADALASGQSDAAVLGAMLAATGASDTAFISSVSQALLGYGAPADVSVYYSQLLQTGSTRLDVVRSYLVLPAARIRAVAQLYQDELGWTTPLATLMSNPVIVALGNTLNFG
jgi:subtilisin family serine protease